jgi:hypothetical protein
MPLTLERRKPQNRAPLLTDLGRESKGKEPQWVHAYIPPTKSKEKGLKTATTKSTRKGSENHQKEETGETQPSLEEPRQIIYTYQQGSYKV